MSNIVLQPNASGTGNITIATPNTNTDRTLNIPDVAGDLVTTGDTGSVTAGMVESTFDLSSKTVTLNKNASSLVHLARIDASPSASTYEWSMNYTDYTHFRIIVERITGSSSSGSENLDVKFKFDGTLDNGAATPYNLDGNTIGSTTVRGANNVDNCEWMHTNNPSYHWNGVVDCYNFGPNNSYAMMNSVITGIASNAQQAFHYTSGTDQSVSARITAMRIAFTAGNVDTVKLDIYGVKS